MLIDINTSTPYKVEIKEGLINNLGNRLLKLRHPCKILVITDKVVDSFYADQVCKSLEASGYNTYKTVFEAGENLKSFDNLHIILDELANHQFTKSDMLLALGGGTVGDLTGFAASVYHRGIGFVQVPTTLLACVDSSVGGKNAINMAQGKNLAGTFWQPLAVLIDTNFLMTLPYDEILNGLSEAIKSGIIGDKELFELIENTHKVDLSNIFTTIIEKSIKVKTKIVESDEKETGERQLLNLGHTIGHSIEKLLNYRISHGMAVAFGMLAISKISCELKNILTEEEMASAYNLYLRLKEIFVRYDYSFNFTHENLSGKVLSEYALQDKKRTGNTITLVLPIALEKCKLIKVHIDDLTAVFSLGL